MFALKNAVKLPRCIQVEWEDGLQASFNYLWLQDNSPKRPSLVHLDLHTKPEAVKCSPNGLNIVWPPYSNSDYSSQFLRSNALAATKKEKEMQEPINRPSTSTAEPFLRRATNNSHQRLTKFHASTSGMNSVNVKSVPFKQRAIDDAFFKLRRGEASVSQSSNEEEIWALVDAGADYSPYTVHRSYWGGASREPGTVCTHMSCVPTICAVDALSNAKNNAPVILSVVDACRAMTALAARHPSAFEFLSQNFINYSEGIFNTRHNACHCDANGNPLPGVFNNMTRSTQLTAEPVEPLYASLQLLGRICGEMTRFVRVPVGKRLLVDNTRGWLGAPTQTGRRVMITSLG